MGKKRKTISIETKNAVIEAGGPYCCYCDKEGFVSTRFGKPVVLEREPYKKWINEFDGTFIFEHRAMEFDHVIPLHKGGTNTAGNIVIACRSCNRKKGSKHGGR